MITSACTQPVWFRSTGGTPPALRWTDFAHKIGYWSAHSSNTGTDRARSPLLSPPACTPLRLLQRPWACRRTASSLVYTMVETAKANGVNPYHYLAFLLERFPSAAMSGEELDRLSPWNEDVKAELLKRAENGISENSSPAE